MTSKRTKAARKASQLEKDQAATGPVRLTQAEIEALRQDKKDAVAWLAKAQGRKVRTTDDLLDFAEASARKGISPPKSEA
jgi:hypothetical protein